MVVDNVINQSFIKYIFFKKYKNVYRVDLSKYNLCVMDSKVVIKTFTQDDTIYLREDTYDSDVRELHLKPSLSMESVVDEIPNLSTSDTAESTVTSSTPPISTPQILPKRRRRARSQTYN